MLARYAPVFVLQTAQDTYNRIGAATARLDGKGREEIFIDASRPVVYGRRLEFETPNGRYTNLVYRVHFERVPLPHLTAGRNVGLLVVITLDGRDRPVLVSTVHTCGCYLAFLPTSYLPEDAHPVEWRDDVQEVYGELLPGRLHYPPSFDSAYRPVVYLRDATHRVMDVRVEDVREAEWRYATVPLLLEPVEALDSLPAGDGTVSFFETEGARRGYVRNSHKPLERLLISWWALDWRVGEDKRFGDSAKMNTVFYTSLKPWRREESDMWRFADFLRFWGWRL